MTPPVGPLRARRADDTIRTMRAARLVIGAVVVLAPGLILAPVWQLGGLGAGEDDVLYYYPARTFFHESLQAGQWPWWNPWTGLGRPYLADPQTAFFYPSTWLFAAMSPRWAYPASLWIHYSLALWGMYRLLRAWGQDRRAALFGGLAFAFSGFLLAHRAHFTMQHAAAWTPWVLWRLLRFVTPDEPAAPEVPGRGAHRGGPEAPATGDPQSNPTPRLRSGLVGPLTGVVVVITLQALAGHVQVAALTGVGGLVFLLSRVRPSVAAWSRAAGRWLLAYVGAAGLFAVQWFPTVDYVRLCTRVERTYADFVENSWNPVSAVGWLLPMLFGQRTPNLFDQPYWGPSHQVEQFGYMGIVPLLLAVLALRRGWRYDARRRPWAFLAFFALLLALGTFGPICPLLYWLPGSSLFRCPARALLLVNLAVAALAAITLHDLGATPTPDRARLRASLLRWTRRPVVVTVLLVAVPVGLVVLATPLVPLDVRAAARQALRPWNVAVWVPPLVIFVSLWLLRHVAQRWQQPQELAWLAVLVAVDLGVIGWTIDVPAGARTPADLLTPRRPAAWMDLVAGSPHRLWVVTSRRGWTPGEYVEPIEKAVANTNVLRGIVALPDYGPFQPRGVVRRLGFHPWGESWWTKELLADTGWMRACNVGWVLVCDADVPAPADCDLALTTDAGWRLYANPSAGGWAFFADPAQPGAVRYERQGPSAFSVWVDTWPTSRPTTAGVGAPSPDPLLVVSELALPGWSVTVDGHPAEIEPADGWLLGVRIPPGRTVRVDGSYRPPGLRAGAAVSLVSVGALGLACIGEVVAAALTTLCGAGRLQSGKPKEDRHARDRRRTDHHEGPVH